MRARLWGVVGGVRVEEPVEKVQDVMDEEEEILVIKHPAQQK